MAYVVFCPCVLIISNHLIHLSPRNGDLNAKKRVSRQGGVAYCLKISVAEIENHHSPRYKITVMFRDLISREFSPCN